MGIRQTVQGVVVATTPERVALARRAHRSAKRTFFIVFFVLAGLFLPIGLFLASRGQATIWSVVLVTAILVVIPFLAALPITRMERKAELFLAADGATQFVVGAQSLTIGDLVVPYERITMVYAQARGEYYSGGGIRGEALAYRLDLANDRPGPGRAAGAIIGTRLRRKLYREGAKSTISLAIGIDRAQTIAAPAGVVSPLKALPKRGDDPARIDVPFGAYLGFDELEALLGTLFRATSGTAFPIGVVSGVMNWEMALASACDPRQEIWERFPSLVPQQ